ncbi:MAG: DEAD/DEAH box helicase [Corynebacterium sp.]|nr:DEAD/DEAH box helicase [Corynebacterium sp.]
MSHASFEDLGVAVEITEALDAAGIRRPFAIQASTIPLALDGKDIIGQARTGSGKTLSFAIPVLDRVFDDAALPELNGKPHAVILVPTRELAQQVTGDVELAGQNLPVQVLTVVGGVPMEAQKKALKRGVDIIIGTPGRIIDLYKQGALDFSEIGIVVLDEADEMLDLGFYPDIEYLMKELPEARQNLLFSATMPGAILSLARQFMRHPVRVQDEKQEQNTVNQAVEQIIFQAHQMDKIEILARALQSPKHKKSITFVKTKRQAAALSGDLAKLGFVVGAVHGDMQQSERERSLQAFRDNEIKILVATDIAARGLDIDDISHVFNYQIPDDAMTFIHRSGRTGRAGMKGISVTMVGYDETTRWAGIAEDLKLNPNPPQWFSTSDELYAALDIPAGTGPSIGPARKVFGAKSPAASRTIRRPRVRRAKR